MHLTVKMRTVVVLSGGLCLATAGAAMQSRSPATGKAGFSSAEARPGLERPVELPTAGSCEDCHGQPPDWWVWPDRAGAHATHMSALNGPAIDDCYVCHAAGEDGAHENGLASFATGTDANSNGNIELSETDVCDGCHSPDGPFDGVAEGMANWQSSTPVSCEGCHDTGTSVIGGVSAPPVAGDDVTWGYYATGHGRSGAVLCTQCHDAASTHIDGQPRTYAFNTGYYGPTQSGVAYAAGYRLSYVGGEVPLMIPANYNITFGYDAWLMSQTAFRLCFECHNSDSILDDTPGNGISSNFKASLPNPPRNYSYSWGSGADVNEHVAHIMNYIMTVWDSDWDAATTGSGPGDWDSLVACSSCHNVHGAAGVEGSSNEPMIRDGTLAGRTGYGFSYVIEDIGAGGYPQVTSTEATQADSVGAIFRNHTGNMCGGSMCHGQPAPPGGPSYDASGSSWGTYLEYYRPWESHGPVVSGACCDTESGVCSDVASASACEPPLQFRAWVSCAELEPPCGLGACCSPGGQTCYELTEADCPTIDQWLWLGYGISCDSDPCPSPVGACCAGLQCGEVTESICTTEIAGTYLGDDTACDFESDCNSNGNPDACDIALGTSPDEDGDGIPDECEPCGDLDGDLGVDADDYAIFRASFGLADGDALFVAACDYDGDGEITLRDYQAWLMCYREFIGYPQADHP